MYNCFIVDDEQQSVDVLTSYIVDHTQLRLLGSEINPVRALQKITELKPDITFMAVNMKLLSGFELTDMVQDLTKVIFTTSEANHAVTAYEKNVYDFLLKPIPLPRFLKAVKRVEMILNLSSLGKKKEDDDHSFYINPGIRGTMVRLNYNEIIYIEGLKNYVLIYTMTEKYVTYLTMTEIEAALPKIKFMRIQKSFIINLEKLKSIDGQNATLCNGATIGLGNVYKKRLTNFIASKTIRTSRKQL